MTAESWGPGYLSAAPADVPAPSTSVLNYGLWDVVPNHVMVGVSASDTTVLGVPLPARTLVIRAGVSPAHVILDGFRFFSDVTPPA